MGIISDRLGTPTERENMKQPNYCYWCTIERVVDGDTVDIVIDLGFKLQIRERVRLYGIDAPETRTRDLEEKKRGLEAKAFVEDHLPVGDHVLYESLTFEGGKYGRAIGSLYPNSPGGESIQQLLLDAGLAVQRDYG